jgi:hypothetical protein
MKSAIVLWALAFSLTQQGTTTRLVSRSRIATPNASPLSRAVSAVFMEPGSLVMERKMLMGIRQRAELWRAKGQRQSANP